MNLGLCLFCAVSRLQISTVAVRRLSRQYLQYLMQMNVFMQLKIKGQLQNDAAVA